MSTFTGLVPLINLDAPAPRPPLYGLLSSPDAAVRAPQRDRWQGGARFDRYPSAIPTGWDPCAEGTFRDKDEPDPSGISGDYAGFPVYLGDICTSFAVAQVWEAWRGKAEAALDARTGWVLERQLAWGTYATVDHFLADADMAVPAGVAAVPAQTALAYLEDWLSQFGQRGVISVTPAVATYLGPERLVKDGQQLRTMAGTPVIVGQGYATQDSEDLQPGGAGTGDGAEAAAGQDWIFAHPQVVYQYGSVLLDPEPIREAIDTDDNTVVFRAERELWVGFDGDQGHAAVLADWSP